MELKNIFSKKVLTLLSASILFCGCEDFLTRDHPTAVTDDDFWGTINECNSALGACKYWPQGTHHYSAPYLSYVHLEGTTDNMYWSGNFKGEIANLGNGSATTTTGGYMGDIWSEYYMRIRRCNRFLDHVGGAYFVEEYERERMIAEARTWRAWYHMQLLLFYGMHDGIPIQDRVLNGDEIYKARNTVQECLDFINTEFDAVIAITDNRIYPFLWEKDRRDRMCKAYALTLKMDLNLQFKQYDIAKAAAKAIIDQGVFELYYNKDAAATDTDPGKHYRDMFRYVGQDNMERIMYRASGCSEVWFRNAPQSLSGQGAASVLRSFVDEFETAEGVALNDLPADERTKFQHDPLYKARDPRLYTTVVMPGDDTSFSNYVYEPFKEGSADLVGKVGASRTGYWLKKFLDEQDRPNGSGGSLYFPLYRYAEVLLDYVECLVETGDWQNPDVEKYINMIRNRAGMPNMNKAVYNSQEKVRQLYRRERRVELSFEGKRLWDIRRWGIGNEVMNGLAEGAWNPTTNSFVTVENRNCSFPKYDSWPIPQTEETANPNIEQPTGW